MCYRRCMEAAEPTKPPVDLITPTDGVQHYGSIYSFDARQHALAAYTPLASDAPLPESYYPNLTGIPHWMQNQLGACVGHAAGKSHQVTKFHESGLATVTPFSARFLYAMAKALEGTKGYEQYPRTAGANDGTYPALVASIMKNYGVATEATMPNNTLLDADTYTYQRKLANIPAAAIAEAAKSKISNYAFADITERGIKAAIQFAGENNGGVFMLTEIDKAWWTAADGRVSWAASDIVPLREPSDMATLGGHEIYPYAFDVKNGRTIVYIFNSWSDAWADKGNAWFYLDEWQAHIRQVITTVDLPADYKADNFRFTFTKALRFGMTNSDVVALQHCLRIDGEFPATTPFTGYFGPTTLAAVKAFQVKYADSILTPQGLTQPTGIVGSGSIAKLNALFGLK